MRQDTRGDSLAELCCCYSSEQFLLSYRHLLLLQAAPTSSSSYERCFLPPSWSSSLFLCNYHFLFSSACFTIHKQQNYSSCSIILAILSISIPKTFFFFLFLLLQRSSGSRTRQVGCDMVSTQHTTADLTGLPPVLLAVWILGG